MVAWRLGSDATSRSRTEPAFTAKEMYTDMFCSAGLTGIIAALHFPFIVGTSKYCTDRPRITTRCLCVRT